MLVKCDNDIMYRPVTLRQRSYSYFLKAFPSQAKAAHIIDPGKANFKAGFNCNSLSMSAGTDTVGACLYCVVLYLYCLILLSLYGEQCGAQ